MLINLKYLKSFGYLKSMPVTVKSSAAVWKYLAASGQIILGICRCMNGLIYLQVF